jgi:acetoin utilization deacetylase AcuC-like enzyme
MSRLTILTAACETARMNETPIIYSDHYLDHQTGPHPETAGRLVAIIERLEGDGLLEGRPLLVPTNAPREAILRVHDADYVDALERFCAAGGGML